MPPSNHVTGEMAAHPSSPHLSTGFPFTFQIEGKVCLYHPWLLPLGVQVLSPTPRMQEVGLPHMRDTWGHHPEPHRRLRPLAGSTRDPSLLPRTPVYLALEL